MKRTFLFSTFLMIITCWVSVSFSQTMPNIFTAISSGASFCTANNLIPGDDYSKPSFQDHHKKKFNYVGLLSPGQSLYTSLLSKGIPQKIIQHIILHMNPVFDFKSKSRPKDQYTIILGASRELISFRYQTSPLEIYSLQHDINKQWQATKEKVTLDKYLVHLSGKVRGSVFTSIDKIAKAKYIAAQFIDIFALEIDFQKQAKPEDNFCLLVEKYYRGKEFVCYGKILAAEYQGALIGEKKAYYFQEDEYIEDYYSPKGISLNPKVPLNYTLISSGYSHNRLHPLLGCFKPHLGIDFAAPLGTPLWAVADGMVIYQNHDHFNGNQILIEHENGFISYYNHLSRFAEQIQKGDQVRQRQIIGYVGTTGLSTGPHLDYRLKKNGRFINPLKTNFPSKPIIAKKNKARFDQTKKTYTFFMKNEAIPPHIIVAQIDAQNLKSSRHGPLSDQLYPLYHHSVPVPSQPKLSRVHADQWVVSTGREYV